MGKVKKRSFGPKNDPKLRFCAFWGAQNLASDFVGVSPFEYLGTPTKKSDLVFSFSTLGPSLGWSFKGGQENNKIPSWNAVANYCIVGEGFFGQLVFTMGGVCASAQLAPNLLALCQRRVIIKLNRASNSMNLH